MTYRFIQCKECRKQLPVSNNWPADTEVECGLCGEVQEVGSPDETEELEIDTLK